MPTANNLFDALNTCYLSSLAFRFAQVPNARFGHVQMNLAAILSLRICRLSSNLLNGTPLECI